MKKIKNFFINLIKLIFKKKNIKWFVLLLIIILVILFFSFRKKVNEYVIENHDLYQYFTGFKMEYKGKIKLDKTDNKITQITFGDDTVNLDSTPLFFADEEKVRKDLGLEQKANPNEIHATCPHCGKDITVEINVK